ncbi:hypothetical protein [Prosthecomicrobium sp. N25]|uniref:hypothetical protein n=1 Tax=Prosthecomicrobium sp. N25 TaxID=3129254 RepID=UPI003078A1B3
MTAGIADLRRLDLLARLAHAVLRPADRAHPDRLAPAFGTGTMTAGSLAALLAVPAFRGPVNRALAAALDLDQLPIGPGLLARIDAAPATRAAILLVTADGQSLAGAARALAAAVLHRRIAGMVLKAERSRAAAILGEAGFAVAVHEAPVLHAGLGALAGSADVLAGDPADPETSARMDRYGLACVGRYVEAVEPELLPLLLLRVRPASGYDPERLGIAAMANTHVEQVVRLMRRRRPAWSDTIG